MIQKFQRLIRVIAIFGMLVPMTRTLHAQTNAVLNGPFPSWVRICDWTSPDASFGKKQTEGSRWLLYELQHHPQLQEEFVRIVLHMESEAGVQDSGSLSFWFDPNYQKLILHRVQIHRAGKVLDRLDTTKIKIIQPEPGLYNHLITGKQRALLFVEDLRVGDSLEYAYTLRGANPILNSHFATRFIVQSSLSVDRQRMRVVWTLPTPLHQRQHLTESMAREAIWPGGRELTWDATNVVAIPYEDYQPFSFEPYPYVELSDFADWGQVVQWALPLYAHSRDPLPSELKALIARWQENAASEEEKARRALQFVQDDLRYTALELGPDSYRPTPPLETFQKRFGDCKGKAALFCLLLREMNLQGWPALVNSSVGEAVEKRLPSPFVFDHVIVKLELSGREYWVDPTASYQGGHIENRFLPRYGRALVVREGVSALEEIPPPDAAQARQVTTSTFTMANYEAPVAFTVRTVYRGAAADSLREQFARNDPKDTLDNYLNYYARFYQGVEQPKPLKIADNRDENVLTVTESYQLRDFWVMGKSTKRWEAYFYPDSLLNLLTDPSTRLRKTPLQIPFPLHREQILIVRLPDRTWTIPDLSSSVDHAAFSFRTSRKLSGDTLHLEYECETKMRELPAEDVAEYLKKLNEMEDLLGDTLYRPDENAKSLIANINWLMIMIAVFGFVSVGGASFWVWRGAQRGPSIGVGPPPLLVEGSLRGLGGWLILVGINLCLAPFIRLVSLATNWDGFFSMNVWQALAMPQGDNYHPLYGPLLVFELLGNILLLALNVLSVSLFFGKRRLFPNLFILFVMLNAFFVVTDEVVSSQIPLLANESDNDAARQVSRVVVYAFVWSAYMAKSRRVKATFVE